VYIITTYEDPRLMIGSDVTLEGIHNALATSGGTRCVRRSQQRLHAPLEGSGPWTRQRPAKRLVPSCLSAELRCWRTMGEPMTGGQHPGTLVNACRSRYARPGSCSLLVRDHRRPVEVGLKTWMQKGQRWAVTLQRGLAAVVACRRETRSSHAPRSSSRWKHLPALETGTGPFRTLYLFRDTHH
jgi:hypothetical protein